MRLTQPFQAMILLVLVLAGCSTYAPPSTCMKTVLVSNLSRAPLYPILEDDPRSATILINKTSCGMTKVDEATEKAHIEIDLALAITEARKNYSFPQKVTFSLFVALLDSDDNVIDRQDQNIEVDITEKPTNLVHKIIYLPPQDISADSHEHRLAIGFNERGASRQSSFVHHSKENSVLKTKKQRFKKRKTG
jgi:hypothetical protein